MKETLKRYTGLIVMMLANIILIFVNKEIGIKSVQISGSNLIEMLQVLPPVFILLGLMDVWVPREVMIKLMGEESGIVGILIAFLLGSFAAGPLYAAFPVALLLIKKGSKFSNVLIFIGAWSTTKIPMILFEVASMGWKFAITRLTIDVIGIIIIGYLIEALIGKSGKEQIYKAASLME